MNSQNVNGQLGCSPNRGGPCVWFISAYFIKSVAKNWTEKRTATQPGYTQQVFYESLGGGQIKMTTASRHNTPSPSWTLGDREQKMQ